MENQRKTITFGPVGKYDNLNPQVEPVRCKYADMVSMRDEGKLIPGQLYRITDYVTTVNEFLEPNARSAGHQFDIIVLALDATTLSEDAMAARHDGDEYFANSRLEAWELKYRLDNVQWSARKGTYYTDSNGYVFYDLNETIEIDGTTYHLLQGLGPYVEDWADHAVVVDFQQGSIVYAYYDDGDLGEYVGDLEDVEEVTSDGKGTITYLKDEFNNECPYDFKNIQFKRYMTTDAVTERDGLDGEYMVADPDNCPPGLSVNDTDDFIWAYTFNITLYPIENDSSLSATYGVHDNVIRANALVLNNIVIYGVQCYDITFGIYCSRMSFKECISMSFGSSVSDMYFASDNGKMYFKDGCSRMVFGIRNYNMSFGYDVIDLSFVSGCMNATISDYVGNVAIGKNTLNFQIQSGISPESQIAPDLETQKTYNQVVCLNSSGQLKIYVPGDLVQ